MFLCIRVCVCHSWVRDNFSSFVRWHLIVILLRSAVVVYNFIRQHNGAQRGDLWADEKSPSGMIFASILHILRSSVVLQRFISPLVYPIVARSIRRRRRDNSSGGASVRNAKTLWESPLHVTYPSFTRFVRRVFIIPWRWPTMTNANEGRRQSPHLTRPVRWEPDDAVCLLFVDNCYAFHFRFRDGLACVTSRDCWRQVRTRAYCFHLTMHAPRARVGSSMCRLLLFSG